jgi:RNA recognition motif-containing protein
MMTPGMGTPGMGTPGMGTPGSFQRLPPEVNRILYVRNLPFSISSEELYKIFGDYGAIRQIRQCVVSSSPVWRETCTPFMCISEL